MKASRVLLCAAAVLALATTQAFAWSFGSTKLTVANPAGAIEVKHELAPRLADLNGKKVAMWLSGDGYGTGRGDVLYNELAKEIQAAYPKVTILPYTQFPIKYSPFNDVFKAIADAKPDAVIVGAGG